jgi:hypothetical protein
MLALLLLSLGKHLNFKSFFKGEYTEENKPKEKEDDNCVKKIVASNNRLWLLIEWPTKP